MNAKRLCLIIMLLVAGYQRYSISAEVPAATAKDAAAKPEPDKQLKINKDALLNKSSIEQIRIDAATVMLFSENPLARKVLIDTLKQSENNLARAAVCKALSQTRVAQKPVKSKEDFIQPLLEFLTTEDDFSRAKLAAEATLIFKYEQISEPLEKIVTDASLPVKARLNTIDALKRPDIGAISKLMDLLDDSNKEVAVASERALMSLGIPVSKDPEIRRQIIDGIKRQGKDEFLRSWELRQEQEKRMRELEKERNFWQNQYLLALNRIYDSIGDDAVKGQFLGEHLGNSKAVVRLWALEKVSQWRVGTKSKLPTDKLGPVLVNLVSDSDRAVRLKTAKLLSLMGELNSAEKLLEQLKVEQDEEVQMELFVALGGACYYAFLPNSGIKISPEVRKQTLEWAAKYLFEQGPEKAQKGAEVIKKLLEQDGLTPNEVGKYLGLLSDRYKRERDKPDGILRGELLGAMAGLCAQSAHKTESARRFAPLFEEGLSDKTDLVREAAVEGLVYIDKTKALKILRKDFVNDSSTIVRRKLTDLASEVGGKEDLVWLTEKTGITAEGEPAWQAMLKIFNRSDAATLSEWISSFNSQGNKSMLSDEQRVSLLKIAERKPVGEKKLEMLKTVREELVQLYIQSGEFEQAAEYLGMLRQVASTPEEKQAILANLLDVYLKWPNVDAAAQLVNNCLLEKDLDPNNVVVLTIDKYLAKPPAASDPNSILQTLAKIKTTEARPIWAEQLKHWIDRLDAAKKQDK